MAADIDAVATWFETERGITRDTLRAFGVGIDGDNVSLPYDNGLKHRPDPTQPLGEKRRFYFTQGRKPCLYHRPGENPGKGKAILMEGETDTMRTWQELRAAGHDTAVYGLSGIDTWSDSLASQLDGYDTIYVVLDNDEDYAVRDQVDRVWRKIRNALGGRAKRVWLPNDVKDACEFFARYNIETLGLLLTKVGASRFQPVDFSIPPPPVEWILEGWVAKGDVAMLVGKAGLGKSWFTMGLANAMLHGGAFLDLAVSGSRILYVDEENPLDVIHSRMKRLGLDPYKTGTNLRYLWNQHIRLDNRPEILLDEALDFKPDLVVVDSLTRVHGKEEKDAGAMAELMNYGIKPLARDAGAAVVVIHHHGKDPNGSRGSSDIDASADAVIEMYDRGRANPGKFELAIKKSRRKNSNPSMIVGITDYDDGTAGLERDPVIVPPF